jgi:hypothetical protein
MRFGIFARLTDCMTEAYDTRLPTHLREQQVGSRLEASIRHTDFREAKEGPWKLCIPNVAHPRTPPPPVGLRPFMYQSVLLEMAPDIPASFTAVPWSMLPQPTAEGHFSSS